MRKEYLKSLSLLICTIIFLELLSMVLYVLFTKKLYNISSIRVSRNEVLNQAKFDGSSSKPGVDRPWKMGIHPFFGTGFPAGFKISSFDHSNNQKEKLVIAVTGGSVAQGVFESFKVSLMNLLKEKGYKGVDDIKFYLLGQGTWKQPQQVAAIAYFLSLGNKIDVLINLDGHNEVVDTSFNRSKGVNISYPWKWYDATMDIKTIGKQKKIGKIVFLRSLKKRFARISDKLWFSAISNLFWTFGNQFLQNCIQKEVVGLERLNKGNKWKPFFVTGPSQSFKNEDEFYSASADLWENGSIQLNRIAMGNNFKYFHFLQPNQYVPESKELTEEEYKIAYRNHPNHIIIKGYSLLEKASERLLNFGVRYKSLVYIFKETKESVYSDSCCHLNDRGNKILANQIAINVLPAFFLSDGSQLELGKLSNNE